MRNLRYKKIIVAVCLIASSTLVFQPKPANALGVDWVNAALQVVGHAIQDTLLGIDSTANTISTALQSVREVLNGIPIEYGPARKALSAAVTSCEVIGGDFMSAQKFSDLAGSGSSSDGSTAFDEQLYNDFLATHTIGSGGIPDLSGDNQPTPTPNTNNTVTPGEIPFPNTSIVDRPEMITSEETNSALDGLAGSLAEVGDQTKANLTLVLGQKLGLLKHRKTCYKILNQSLQAGSLIGSFNEQLKAAFRDTLEEIATKSAPVNSQINDLTKQQIAAKQDVFKAIAQSVALQTNEAKTTDTVEELKPKLTVGSVDKVKKATALRVYAVDAIKKNYDNDKNKQLIMTMLLDAEQAPDKESRDQALRSAQGLVQKDILTSCKQFYQLTDYTQEVFNDIPDLVDPSCSLDRVFDSYKAEFAKIVSDSTSSAEQELANGGGFLSTRDCVDTTEQEKQVSEIAGKNAYELAMAEYLRSTFETNGDMSNPAYIDAINKEKQAVANMHELPNSLDGGIKTSCGPIIDAGGIIKTNYENYINQWMTQGLQGSKSDNAPLQTQFAKTVVDTLFGKIVLNKKGSNNVFSELGRSVLSAVLTGVKSNSTTSVTGIAGGRIPIVGNVSSNAPAQAPPHSSPTVSGDVTTIPVIPYMSPRSSGDTGIRGGGF